MKTNWTRVILGGLLAGLIINILETIASGFLLRADWEAVMSSLGKPAQFSSGQMTAFYVLGFLIGLFALWLYVTIRPRFGPGPKTAVIAGIAVWIPNSLLAMVAPAVMGIFGAGLAVISILIALVEIVAGTVAGAWLYKDREAAEVKAAGART